MTSLTDRYVAATLRSVPVARRDEIAAELRASIDDMVEGRSADGRDTGVVEREVLTELGDPARLAARYADRRLQLIGPTYFLVWQRLLVTLLSIIPGLVGVIVALVEATVDDNIGGAVGTGVVAAFQTAVQIAFWVTVVFAVLERVGAPLDLPGWTVDDLPDAPADRDVPLSETCASVVMLLLTIGFLAWQHVQTQILTPDGDRLPILDEALWTSWLPFLIAVLVASIGLEVAKYRARRWTWRLVGVNALLDLAFAVPVIGLLLTDRLFNPEFVQRIEWVRDGDNLNVVARGVAVGVAAVTLWDLVDSAIKARRSAR
ncbi:HAAS signaling domain-containing protein [Micromonospora endolithica]|uniref:Uncharacterized protein n=1 Tax=Micromonospora endolithica TaxID=230091 RepID=A0A3A9YYN2_9ACTN|nr:hypothetical protein [Micromonospora endolithica]RKN40316.1 hypothetical protein D7223_27365 [Micromonospora endolithica]TWJ22643.1 hypothetical protein JD76_02765 [Micromonospora endolithica]